MACSKILKIKRLNITEFNPDNFSFIFFPLSLLFPLDDCFFHFLFFAFCYRDSPPSICSNFLPRIFKHWSEPCYSDGEKRIAMALRRNAKSRNWRAEENKYSAACETRKALTTARTSNQHM